MKALLIVVLGCLCGGVAAVAIEDQLHRHGVRRSRRDELSSGLTWVLFACFLIALGYSLTKRG